jgi:Tfp pilus assembly protein PilO
MVPPGAQPVTTLAAVPAPAPAPASNDDNALLRGTGSPLQSKAGLRFSGDINLGHILQAGMLGCSLIVWLVMGAAKSEGMRSDLDSLQARVESSQVATRAEIKEAMGATRGETKDSMGRLETALASLSVQVSAMPEMLARVNVMDREFAKALERGAARDSRLDNLRQSVVEMRADVDALRRASAVSLPGARGVDTRR